MFLRWMDRYPSDYQVLGNYADSMMRRGNHGLAIHLYTYLITNWKDVPDGVVPIMWANIGQALLIERYQDEAEYAFNRALELDDKNAAIYNSMAGCYINQAQPDLVIKWCNKALEYEPDLRQALWNRSIGYLEKEDWPNAWWGYLQGERIVQQRSYEEGRKMEMWNGKRSHTTVVWGEQGVGDEVMFASCFPDFINKVKNPIIDCHPRLERIFKRSFPGVPVYGTRKTKQIDWHHNHKIDSQIAIGSLPYYFRKTTKSFPGTPYLKADPERIKHYRFELEKLGPGPYVGVAWFGGEKKTRFDYRAIPLPKWQDIFDTGCTFTSLQYDKWGHDKEADKIGLHNFKEANSGTKDFEDIFALIMACDLVISVCQSVVHFSGALGKECWCLTPSRPAWRYGLKNDHIAWYGKTVTCIRQKEGEKWNPVIQETVRRLIEYKEKNSVASADSERDGNIPVGGREGMAAMVG